MGSEATLTAVILIISETASQDPSTDKCIPALKDVFQEAGSHWKVAETAIVPDSILDIQQFITQITAKEEPPNVIITSGGTGFATKDITPEAVTPLIQKHAPGLVHGMLAASLAVTPFALMSRPCAGVRNKTLILTLPGSPKGAKENLQSIIKLLPHACTQAAGANSRQLHAGGIKKLEKDAGVESGAGSVIPLKPSGGHHHHHHHHHAHGGHSHKGPVPHPEVEAQLVSNDPNAGPSRRHRESPYPMIPGEDGLKLIAEHTPLPTVMKVPVNGDLVGCVLAEDVVAAESVPAFRASIVDGYAVKIPEFGFKKGVYPIALVSHAEPGEVPPIQEGQIARITTGAPLPPGADAVVMVEHTILKSQTDDGKDEKEVEILVENIKPNENVRQPGSDVQAGDKILSKGEGITAIGGELGLLASVGVTEVVIYKKPIVGVMSTGDEIVNHDKQSPLRIGEVRDSNRPTLLTAVKGAGFEAVDLGMVTDKAEKLEEALRSALRRVDVIITSGGVSMGELDLLKPTIERSLGGTIHFGRVAIKPGKPTTFATIPFKDNDGNRQTKTILSLPGNPAASVVSFNVFVLPCLHQLSGITPVGLPKVKVVLEEDAWLDEKRTEYQRVIVVAKSDGLLYASITGGQRSSRIGSFKGANALLILRPGKGTLEKGKRVDALLMGKLLSDLSH